MLKFSFRVEVVLLTVMFIIFGGFATISLLNVAFADAPSLQITHVNDQSTSGSILITATEDDFPVTVDVTVRIDHEVNAHSVKDLTLFVNDVQHGSVISPSNSHQECDGSVCTYDMPWEITEAGEFSLFVQAYHGNKNDDSAVSATVEVSIIEPDPEPSSITIVKEVTGTSTWEFDFSGDLGELTLTNSASSSTHNELATSTYVITEGETSEEWTLLGIECVGTDEGNVNANIASSSVAISLGEGEDVICTFSNEFSEPEPEPATNSLTIVKEVMGEDAPEEWSFSFSGDLSTTTLTNTTSSWTASNLATSTYVVTEDNLTEEWTLTSIVCEGAENWNADSENQSVSVDLEEGEHVTCTFTNGFDGEGGDDGSGTSTDSGAITVTKIADGGDETFDFNYEEDSNEENSGDFQITTEDGSGSFTVSNLVAGFYSIFEALLPQGWSQASSTCVSIEVAEGESADCTITNVFDNEQGDEEGEDDETATSSITIVKEVEGAEEWSFNFSLSLGTSTLSTTTLTNTTSSWTASNLATSTYVITEELSEGWTLTASTTCTGTENWTVNFASSSVSVDLGEEEDVTCTFTNDFDDGEEGGEGEEEETPDPVDPEVDEPVSATDVNAGDPLASSTLSGTFEDGDGNTVDGDLAWEDGDQIVNEDGNFVWVFTPTASSTYNTATGTVAVSVTEEENNNEEEEETQSTGGGGGTGGSGGGGNSGTGGIIPPPPSEDDGSEEEGVVLGAEDVAEEDEEIAEEEVVVADEDLPVVMPPTQPPVLFVPASETDTDSGEGAEADEEEEVVEEEESAAENEVVMPGDALLLLGPSALLANLSSALTFGTGSNFIAFWLLLLVLLLLAYLSSRWLDRMKENK